MHAGGDMNDEKSQRTTCGCGKGVSRRSFIKSMSASAVGVAVTGRVIQAQAAQPEQPADPRAMIPARLRINGASYELLVEPRWTLLFVLREKLGLTAAKIGCERGECGACTVLVDGVPRYSCLMLAMEAEGSEVETAEGLMDGEVLSDVQQSFVDEDGLQCGYCTPGQVMAAEGLLRENPAPEFDEIRRGMSGNLCRCGTYAHIFNSVATASRRRNGGQDG
jgi:xanthine dehydrogenase YagT iron-sulfur-binding subunit